jgi:hypothetical protein
MDSLIQLLQNNPLVILIMFVISLISGIIGIYIGWRKFYEDVLSKRVTLPVYAYLVIFFFVALLIIFWPAVEDRPKKLRTIEREAFGVQRVIVDGKRFVNCTFRKTELVFRGEASSAIENCTLIKPSLTFDGPAATTARILRSLYKVPQLQPFIENTFKAIKEDKLPRAIPPSDAAND